ncbi:MAG: FkbM family methyltransferase [Pyrinomonadaceae bacterium]|nr:FkbM family methyltransferase [Pyrinomonadaceae bacterium]
MGSNSLVRRVVKKTLYPVFNETTYRLFQGLAMAWDIRKGNWSEPELDLLPYAVREGDTVLDVGANYGLYSYRLGPLVGPSGVVYAFEPLPFTFKTLKLISRILRFSGNVKLVRKGCSDREQTIAFTVPVQDSGAQASGLAHISGRQDGRAGKETQVRWNETKEVICEVVALDEFLPSVTNLSLIKCDVEGAELLAFRGAEKLIDQHEPTVICEINPWYMEGFGLPLNDLTDFFFRKGYSLYSYDWKATRCLVPIDDSREIVEDNYLFIHPRRLDNFASLIQTKSP